MSKVTDRFSPREIEPLPAASFVVIAGAAGGVLQRFAEFIHDTTAGAIASFVTLNAAAAT